MTHENMPHAFLIMPVKKESKSSQLSQVNVTVPLKRMTAKVNTDATPSKCGKRKHCPGRFEFS